MTNQFTLTNEIILLKMNRHGFKSCTSRYGTISLHRIDTCRKCYVKLEPIDGTGIKCRKCRGGQHKSQDLTSSNKHVSCLVCEKEISKKQKKYFRLAICKPCIMIQKARINAEKMRIAEKNSIKTKKVECSSFCKECELDNSSGCCHCRDKRSYKALYEGYLDGVGKVCNLTRNANYCPSCKIHCEQFN